MECRLLNYMRIDKKIKIVVMIGFITKNSKILCIKRKKEPWVGMLSLPGGKMERGETETECLTREIREETGYIIEPLKRDPVVVSKIKYKGQSAMYKIYECAIKGGKENPQDEEVEKIVWVDARTFLDDLKLHGFGLIAFNQLEEYLKKKGFLRK